MMNNHKNPEWAMLAAAALLSFSAPTFAQEAIHNDETVLCQGQTSCEPGPIAASHPAPRPLIKIGTMQAWAMMGKNGDPVLALTTEDGLTIIGKVLGPQGEDISGALLAAVPRFAPQAVSTSPPDQPGRPKLSFPLDSEPQTFVSNGLRQLDTTPKATVTTTDTPTSRSTSLQNVNPVSNESADRVSIDPNADVTSQNEGPDAAAGPAAVTAVDIPSPEIQAGLNKLLEEATSERMWFQAATPQSGAPVIYMLADPDCPHCQWSIDSMHSLILGGQIDLRIIPAPITGPPALRTTLSILHSKDVAGTFMNHMTSKSRGTPAVTQMDARTADRDVVQSVGDNVAWMRRNGIGSVPFFLYKDAKGATFSLANLPQNILQIAESF